MSPSPHPRIPGSTYRLQFHAGFTFADARNALDYLGRLGVTDIYASPYFQAAPESTHGYDVADHNRINPAIGDDSEFHAWCAALKERGMGQILDFVPNHMGIGQSLNQWWREVLEDGLASPFACYFDIDWHPRAEALQERVLLPILGDRYGKVLENGEFSLHFGDGEFELHYFDTHLPLRPQTYPIVLREALAGINEAAGAEMRDVIGLLADPSSKQAAKEKLRDITHRHPDVAEAIREVLRRYAGEKGVPSSFDPLHSLLEQQVYRLGYWRIAAEEINYRRFFDINTLAAIRVEIPEVFSAAHQLVFDLLARGDVTGLRIDHIDGLWDPRAYLQHLQETHHRLCGGPAGRSLYVVVEKILEVTGETLPADWPAHGTTGYEFANLVVQTLIDSRAGRRLTRVYERFTGRTTAFADLVYEKKKLTMLNALGSEVAALGRMLDELSEMHRQFRDYTRNMLTAAVREVLACFPVYRTYVGPDGTVTPQDEKVVLRAILAARRRNPSMEKAIFDFLRAILLLRLPEGLSDRQREAHVRFVLKFQQCSGPVMAKGLEDTSFYIYNRLVALNEVGGNPGCFGLTVRDFHAQNAARARMFPHGMLATSTHDTKRSEDVRMRIAAVSEFPGVWRESVLRWSRLNAAHRREIAGEWAPSRNEEYLLYQTLAGAWPLGEGEWETFPERIRDYMLKAIKEAKENSSWTEPNEEWESAVAGFVDGLLKEEAGRAFRDDFAGFVERIAWVGALNSLTQTILKCTVPGVPDFYQGSEIWDLSLVDPDNRRPVDFSRRQRLLETVEHIPLRDLLSDWKTGAVKMALTRTILAYRRDQAEFFRDASYVPLTVNGEFRRHVIAFARRWSGREIVVIVPRLAATFGRFPLGPVWGDTTVGCSPGGRDLLSNRQLPADGTGMRLAGVLSDLPFAVIER